MRLIDRNRKQGANAFDGVTTVKINYQSIAVDVCNFGGFFGSINDIRPIGSRVNTVTKHCPCQVFVLEVHYRCHNNIWSALFNDKSIEKFIIELGTQLHLNMRLLSHWQHISLPVFNLNALVNMQNECKNLVTPKMFCFSNLNQNDG